MNFWKRLSKLGALFRQKADELFAPAKRAALIVERAEVVRVALRLNQIRLTL